MSSIRHLAKVALAKDKELERHTAEAEAMIAEIDRALKEARPIRNFAEEIKQIVLKFEASQNEPLKAPAEEVENS